MLAPPRTAVTGGSDARSGSGDGDDTSGDKTDGGSIDDMVIERRTRRRRTHRASINIPGEEDVSSSIIAVQKLVTSGGLVLGGGGGGGGGVGPDDLINFIQHEIIQREISPSGSLDTSRRGHPAKFEYDGELDDKSVHSLDTYVSKLYQVAIESKGGVLGNFIQREISPCGTLDTSRRGTPAKFEYDVGSGGLDDKSVHSVDKYVSQLYQVAIESSGGRLDASYRSRLNDALDLSRHSRHVAAESLRDDDDDDDRSKRLSKSFQSDGSMGTMSALEDCSLSSTPLGQKKNQLRSSSSFDDDEKKAQRKRCFGWSRRTLLLAILSSSVLTAIVILVLIKDGLVIPMVASHFFGGTDIEDGEAYRWRTLPIMDGEFLPTMDEEEEGMWDLDIGGSEDGWYEHGSIHSRGGRGKSPLY